MKGRFIGILIIAASLASLLEGCVQQEPMSYAGQPVRFDACTEAAPATKTAYSGVVNGSNIERIDWEAGDRIQIVCNEVSAPTGKTFDYDLMPDTQDGKLHYASATPHGASSGLLWGAGSHVFYAMYPAYNAFGTGLVRGSGKAVATAIIPADQSYTTPRTGASENYYARMDLAYMLAANRVGEPGDDSVLLPFFPIVTTFYVTVSNTTGAAMTLRRVSLSSASCALTGTFTATMSSVAAISEGELQSTTARNYTLTYSPISYSPANSTVYADLPGLSIANGGSVTVALFAVPQADITDLTLSITADETGLVSRLLKEGSPAATAVFSAGKKHNITNVAVPEVIYEIVRDIPTVTYDQTGTAGVAQTFHVTSTKTVGSHTYSAPWKAQIKVSDTGDDTVDWVDMTAGNRPAWMSDFPLTSAEVAGIPSSGADVGRGEICEDVDPQPLVTHIDHLKSGKVYDALGAEVDNSYEHPENAVDLSYYDFTTHCLEASRYTANTYIINAPGWYKFPLVYGNAIENNTDPVTNTYTGLSKLLIGDVGHLNNFKKACGNILLYSTDIDNSWLENSFCQSAMLVWQKFVHWVSGVPVYSATNFRASAEPDALGVITNLSVISEGGHYYIRFFIDPDNILPGNAMVASVGGGNGLSGTNNITWSWHIWITDQMLSPVNVVNNSGNYDVLPANLGWIDDSEGRYYAERSAKVRYVNIADGIEHCVSEVLTVLQPELELVSTSGWQTYYQWGRKDPFIYGILRTGDDNELFDVVHEPDYLLSDAHYTLTTPYYDWSQNNYNNLWDSQWNNYGTLGTALPDMKTVYDPSPRRFCVSPENAWNSFSTSSASGAFAEGYFFNTGNGAETMFFPASGYIRYDGNNYSSVRTEGRYWTLHALGTATTRTSYALRYISGTVNVPGSGSTTHYRANAYSVRPVFYH